MISCYRILITFRAVALAFGAIAAVQSYSPVSTANAQSAIRALVNNEPITTYDVQSRARMLNVFSRGQQGEKEALEQLVEERLMLQEASLRGVEISDEQVEAEIASRARQSNLTPEQFGQALAQAGIDPQTFRSFLRSNLAWTEVVRARFRATVEITESEVASALEASGGEAGERVTMSEYMLQQILFVGGAEGQMRSQASAFRSQFRGCDQAIQQASGTPGVVVKPMVRREENQIATALREQLAGMEVGGVTEPAQVEEGIQIVAICEKKAISGQTEAAQDVRSRLQNEQGSLMARRYLRDLRSDAVIEYR